MAEATTQELDIENQSIDEIANLAVKELDDILLGKDFATINIQIIKDKLLNYDETSQDQFNQAIDELKYAGKTNKTYEVEMAEIAEYLEEIIANPNDYRQKYPERIKSLIKFLSNI